MRRRRLTVFLVLLTSAVALSAADPRLVDGVSGAPVEWADWVSKRGTVAVLVWASWAPEAETTIDGYPALEAACERKGLHLVLLDVQETLEEGRRALGDRDEIAWLHDRHGALLKRYHVIDVPSLLIVAPDGKPLARLAAVPEGVDRWRRP
jgi:hypothetical protein